jgi:hypothetical protein
MEPPGSARVQQTLRQEPQVSTLPISYQPVDGIDVRVAKSDGDHDETMILTCPWPESLYAFESTWSALSQNASLVAVASCDSSSPGQSSIRKNWKRTGVEREPVRHFWISSL